MKIIFRLLFLFVLLIIIVSLASIGSYRYLEKWGSKKITLSEPVVIDLPKGHSLNAFSSELEEKNLIDSHLKFKIWVKLFSDYARFQAGPYRFKKNVSPQQIAKKIISGKIYRPIVFKITFPEGFTYKQIAEKCVANGVGTIDEYNKLFNDKEFLTELKVPSDTLEGFVYPATYSFLKVPDAKEIIRKGVKTFWNRLPTDYQTALEPHNIDLIQAVTMASLIESETPQHSERPLIAEVIWRRLKANMPLGIDAAIIYGIQDYNGNISARHLSDRNNPYNTRIHKGLPPTPISSPTIDSLLAVINPANEGNYYFVVDPARPKFHVFAKNFREHSKNVRNYVNATRQSRRNKQ